jgi:hypothetical protein
MTILFFENTIWATEYGLKGRVIEQDLKCAGKRASGVAKVNVSTNCESGGGPSSETGSEGNYELKYQCENCINMLIFYQKPGYMPEVRRIRSDMTEGSLGDITLRKVERHSDYRYDDIITLFLSLLESQIWLDWRPSEKLREVRWIWKKKLLEIKEQNGPSFQKVKKDYHKLYEMVEADP